MTGEKRVLHMCCALFNVHGTATRPGGGSVQGTYRAVRTNTASVGLRCPFARGRALMQQDRRRNDSRDHEDPWSQLDPVQVENVLVGFMRWAESAGQTGPAWYHRAPPVPLDDLLREQDAELEVLLAAASLQPEGTLLLCPLPLVALCRMQLLD